MFCNFQYVYWKSKFDCAYNQIIVDNIGILYSSNSGHLDGLQTAVAGLALSKGVGSGHGAGYVHDSLGGEGIVEYFRFSGGRSGFEAFVNGVDLGVDRVGSPAEHFGPILVVARIDFPLESRYRPPSYGGGGRSSGRSW